MNLTRYVNKKPKILMFTKISIYHHHQQQHLSACVEFELYFACLWDQWSISIWCCCCTQKNSQVWEMLYMYAIEGSQKNLSCHSNCVVWTGAPLRLQCVTLASNRTILPIYTSQKMVHYLEVTTTALLAMLCPLLVTSQEVFQAEVINFFFHFVIIARIVCLWCE